MRGNWDGAFAYAAPNACADCWIGSLAMGRRTIGCGTARATHSIFRSGTKYGMDFASGTGALAGIDCTSALTMPCAARSAILARLLSKVRRDCDVPGWWLNCFLFCRIYLASVLADMHSFVVQQFFHARLFDVGHR